MFSYYGSKSKIIQHYPSPTHDKIIEPFAGSARFALRYFEKDVLLVDKNEQVIKVWRFLQSASPKDILGLPKLTKGLDIRKLSLSDIEKLFLSFFAASGRPSNIVTSFMCHYNGNQNRFKKIAENLYKIKHWKVMHGSYDDLQNENATWFIDPPYQFGGEHYKESNKNLDFKKLKKWIFERYGQKIVCENTKADWMKFKPLVKIQGASNVSTFEAIYQRNKKKLT